MTKAPPKAGTSVLEELWNRGSLKSDSYPQLIRNLQRERNHYRLMLEKTLEEVGKIATSK